MSPKLPSYEQLLTDLFFSPKCNFSNKSTGKVLVDLQIRVKRVSDSGIEVECSTLAPSSFQDVIELFLRFKLNHGVGRGGGQRELMGVEVQVI